MDTNMDFNYSSGFVLQRDGGKEVFSYISFNFEKSEFCQKN